MTRCLSKIFLILFVGLMTVSQSAHAALNLTVMPREGGREISLGRVNSGSLNQEEVRFRITSSAAQQYQVYQRLVEPLTNGRGETVDRDVVLATALDGSNGSGSLYLQTSEPLGYGDQLIYTSSSDGQSDSFNIVYTLDHNALSQSGEFRGRVLFSIRPIGSGTQDEVVVSISFESKDQYELKIDTSSGLDRVILNSESLAAQVGFVQLRLKGNGNRSYQVFQDWIQPLLSAENGLFPSEALSLKTSGLNVDRLMFESPSTVPDKRTLVASGNSSEAQLDVTWQLDVSKIEDLAAGVYRGRLQYEIERNDGVETVPIDFEVEIAPVFKLSVTYPPEGGRFDNLLPNAPPQVRELWLNIDTNLSRPYIVSQDVTSSLANQYGGEMRSDMFTVMEDMPSGSTGQVEHSEFVPVKQGESVLYKSNAKGDSAQFRVIYRIQPFEEMTPGDYTTSIMYSLGEM